MKNIRPARVLAGVMLAILAGPALALGAPESASTTEQATTSALLAWSLPFAALLLSIALLPLIPPAARWWEHNRNKLLVSIGLGAVVCLYYALRPEGYLEAGHGLAALGQVLDHAVLQDYVPFIVLLFSLYTISGGIRLSGDLPAHPITNVVFLFIGAVLASLIGTTGASMVLIRPLLQVNSERSHVRHTVIFFIFLVSNIGGCLLPVGDPPLFLGYLRGVPFFWTLQHLKLEWIVCVGLVLAVYWIMDTLAWRHEDQAALTLDEATRVPLTVQGKFNFLLLAGVVAAVALLVPDRELVGTHWKLPNLYLREIVQLALAALSLKFTHKIIREGNFFTFGAIAEVAALFIGIFITMQVPIELLRLQGPALGLDTPLHFFWASGALSSFLDNAPTYVVFFEAASSMPTNGMALLRYATDGQIALPFLAAVSLGSVFMGANTYIGNGPNFLVKSIAEERGIKMPSFFGYMAYSGAILIPAFIVISLIFFR